ncbi:RNA polymerase II transcription regulator recruiting protein [Aureococcus anophagefferens]|nr:RNA polymerase II transcription regulator recruiting protein [Aureococcus anophagefferens]
MSSDDGSTQQSVVKGAWSAEEDALLLKAIEANGTRKWSVLASHLPGRTGKQCRERWHNQLNPDISKSPWTEDEDRASPAPRRVHAAALGEDRVGRAVARVRKAAPHARKRSPNPGAGPKKRVAAIKLQALPSFASDSTARRRRAKARISPTISADEERLIRVAASHMSALRHSPSPPPPSRRAGLPPGAPMLPDPLGGPVATPRDRAADLQPALLRADSFHLDTLAALAASPAQIVKASG